MIKELTKFHKPDENELVLLVSTSCEVSILGKLSEFFFSELVVVFTTSTLAITITIQLKQYR